REVVVESVGYLGTQTHEHPLSTQQRRIVENLLATCLDDGCRCDRLRLCDSAATALATQLGTPKAFDFSAPYFIRDRQLVDIANQLRQRRGLEPLSTLPPRRSVPLPAEHSFEAVSVRLSRGSADAGPNLRAALRELEGKSLTADAVMNLWCFAVRIAAPTT